MDITRIRFNHRPVFTLVNLAILLPFLTFLGCGGQPATVSGVVTMDGEPLVRGMIGFAPTGGGMRAAGNIQSDGSYTLKTNRESGLDVGEYLVTVVSRELGAEDPKGGPPMPGPYITPKHYAITNSSGLQFNVEQGGNTIDIELSSEVQEADLKPKRKRR